MKSYLALAALTTIVIAMSLATEEASIASDVIPEMGIARHAYDKDLTWVPAPDFMPAGTMLTVLHGDPAQKNADVFLKIPSMAKVPNHWHTSAERMILVSGRLKVTFEGQPTAILTAGTYGYSPAKLRHAGECVSKVPCVLFIAFEEPVDAMPVINE